MNTHRSICLDIAYALIILCAFTACISAQQPAQNTDAAYLKKAEAYQNRQRAYNLSILRSDIKLVDDAAMRCFLRVQIMRFIFEKKVTDYFDTANSLGMECLDDIADPENEVSGSQSTTWRRDVIALLRINSPAFAAKAEKKYPESSEWDDTDRFELVMGGDPAAAANRMVAKIAKGTVPGSIFWFIHELKLKDPQSAVRVLDAMLGYYESRDGIHEMEFTLQFLGSDFLAESTPLPLKKRYFYLLLKLSEKVLREPDDQNLFRTAVNLLKNALPEIKKVLPELFPQAAMMYSALNSKRSNYEREIDEVYNRIAESKDKLAQTISEAESTDNKILKNNLLNDAARLAVKEKKFRLAVDLILRVEYSSEMMGRYRPSFIKNDVLDAALKEKDFESAEYAVEKIEGQQDRGQGILKIAAKLSEVNNNTRALDKLYEGLKLIENTDNSPDKVRTLFSTIPVAIKLDKSKAFDIASSAIKVMNRLPTPNPEDKPGTSERNMYIDQVLIISAYNLKYAFTLLGKAEMSLAYPISQNLQLRDWRLVTQIALETERLYPLPLPDPAKH